MKIPKISTITIISILVLLSLFTLVFFLGPQITGRVTYDPATYTLQSINQTYTSHSTIILPVTESFTSLLVTGNYSGTGTISVTLTNGSQNWSVFELNSAPQRNRITAFAILNGRSSFSPVPVENNSINQTNSTQSSNESTFEDVAPEEAFIEDLPEVEINTTVNDTVDVIIVENATTASEPLLNETSTTSLHNGTTNYTSNTNQTITIPQNITSQNKTNQINDTVTSLGSNETQVLNESVVLNETSSLNQTNSTHSSSALNQTNTSTIINTTVVIPTNVTPLENVTEETIVAQIPVSGSFDFVCEDTCAISPVQSGNIVIDITGNITLTLESFAYKPYEAIAQEKIIENQTLFTNETLYLNVSKYFAGSDLVYDVPTSDLKLKVIDNSLLRIRPKNSGSFDIFVYAVNDYELLRSNTFTVTVQDELIPVVLNASNATTTDQPDWLSSLLEQTTFSPALLAAINNTNLTEDELRPLLESFIGGDNSARVVVKSAKDKLVRSKKKVIIPGRGGVQAVEKRSDQLERKLSKAVEKKLPSTLKDDTVYLDLSASSVVDASSVVEVEQVTTDGLSAVTLDETSLTLLLDSLSSGDVVLDTPMSLFTSESLNITNASAVHTLGYSGAGVNICIVDTGFNYGLFNLSVLNFSNVIDATTNVSDVHGHGTEMLSILSSFAPDANYILVKALSDDGTGYASDVIAGVETCVGAGANIISLSLGGGSYGGYCTDDILAQSVDNAVGNGTTVFVSTGNLGVAGSIASPACAPLAIPVAASTKLDTLASLSNYDNATLLLAPGVGVSVIAPDGSTVSTSGTSLSTPMIAGVSALLLENDSSMTTSTLETVLVQTGVVINGTDRQFSRVDASNALQRTYTNNLSRSYLGNVNGSTTYFSVVTDISNCPGTVSSSHELFNVTADIIGFGGANCFNFDGAKNVTIDCNGHYIESTGNEEFFKTTATLTNASGNALTVRNCVFNGTIPSTFSFAKLDNYTGGITFDNVDIFADNFSTSDPFFITQKISDPLTDYIILNDFNVYNLNISSSSIFLLYTNVTVTNSYFENVNVGAVTNSPLFDDDTGSTSSPPFTLRNVTIDNFAGVLGDAGSWYGDILVENLTATNMHGSRMFLAANSSYTVTVTDSYLEAKNASVTSFFDSSGSSSAVYDLHNNIFNFSDESRSLFDASPTATGDLNTTKATGTPRLGGGTKIGGNYWTNSSGTGYSDTCSYDTDGFCSQINDSKNYLTDYLPLGTGTLPLIDSLVFNATTSSKTTYDNLTAYITSSDADGDSITNITDFRVDGMSMAVLNMPFDTKVTSTTSGAVKDYSTYGNNGTLLSSTTMPTWVSSGCVVGGCYSFDGNDFIEVADAPELDPNAGDFSVSIWVNNSETLVANTNIYPLISKGVSFYDTYEWELVLRGGSPYNGVYFRLRDYGGSIEDMYLDTNLSATLSDGTWHHLVVVVDEGATLEGKLYVDGVLRGNRTSFTNVITGPGELYLGNYSTYSLIGFLDEPMVFDRALSAQQITALYDAGLAGKHLELIVSDETVGHESWTVNVTPTDGVEDGASSLSSAVIIANTLPTIPKTLTPLSGTYSSTVPLVCSGSTDLDGDSVFYTFQSNRTGSWTTIVSNDIDGIYSWDVSALTGSGVALRCYAYDTYGVSSTYSPASNLTLGECVVDADCGAGYECLTNYCFTNPGQFAVRSSSTGKRVMVVDMQGRMAISGSLTESCSTTPAGDEFVIEQSGGSVTAWVNNTGDMCLSGNLLESYSTFTASGNDWLIVNNSGSTVALVEGTSGNLSLRGNVYQNTVFT